MSNLIERVAYFLNERSNVITAINDCPASNMDDYWRWQGHAEARRVLAESLGIDLRAKSHTVESLTAALVAAAADTRGVYEAAAAAQTAENIAEIIEEAADDLDPPITSDWLELRDWFKGQLHTIAAQAREAGGLS